MKLVVLIVSLVLTRTDVVLFSPLRASQAVPGVRDGLYRNAIDFVSDLRREGEAPSVNLTLLWERWEVLWIVALSTRPVLVTLATFLWVIDGWTYVSSSITFSKGALCYGNWPEVTYHLWPTSF